MTGRLVLGRLADRFGAPDILIIGEVTMAALIVAMVWVSGAVSIAVLLFILGIFTRGTSPIIRAMVADSVDESANFHDAFAAYSFASRGSSALCRPIYGYLAAFAGISSVFYASSVVALLTFFPAARYRGSKPGQLVRSAAREIGKLPAEYLAKVVNNGR
jgi:MFS family permease